MNQSPLGLVVLDIMMPFIDGFEMTSAEEAFLKFARRVVNNARVRRPGEPGRQRGEE